jgi:hypothetical protein
MGSPAADAFGARDPTAPGGAQCAIVTAGAEGADLAPKPLRFLAATVQV